MSHPPGEGLEMIPLGLRSKAVALSQAAWEQQHRKKLRTGRVCNNPR